MNAHFLFPLVAGIPVFDGYFCHKIRMFDTVDKMVSLKKEIEAVLRQFDSKVLGKIPLSYGQSLVARIATRHTDRITTRSQKKDPMFWGAVFFTEGSTLLASSSSYEWNCAEEGPSWTYHIDKTKAGVGFPGLCEEDLVPLNDLFTSLCKVCLCFELP